MIRNKVLTTILISLLVGMIVSAIYLDRQFPSTSIQDLQSSAVLIYNDSGHGSGVIVDANAVLTAAHVASHEGLIVRCSGGEEFSVVRIVFDDDSDAAVLYVDDKLPYPPCSVAKELPSAGDEILCIGAPYDPNYAGAVLRGYVVKAAVSVGYWPQAIISDLHGAPGCSGGPVFLGGRLVGIDVGSNGILCCIVPVSEFLEILP